MNVPYNLLREHYERNNERIIRYSKIGRWVSPYTNEIDFLSFFTPIEFSAWQAIRNSGKMPLYPQYPAGPYWLDFANPYFKFCIECDGKQFHQDKEKDCKRDQHLKKLGWTVYRISGADCNRIVDMEIDECMEYDVVEAKRERLEKFYSTTIEGLINALAINYKKLRVDGDEECFAFKCLFNRVTNSDDIIWTPEELTAEDKTPDKFYNHYTQQLVSYCRRPF